MSKQFFEQSNERTLPPDYRGSLLLWDIDKTYLDTSFSSKRGLLRIPFEFAIDKRTIPGSVPLLRALRRGPGNESALVPLYFISGSPIQLRSIIERKMILDGVDYDGITFKDQLGLLLARQPHRITQQVGYKLRALLGYQAQLPQGGRWLMFGDDYEADAEVFTLFGEVVSGMEEKQLVARLEEHGVHNDDVEEILRLAEICRLGVDPVERIFIHLAKKTDPARFTNPRVVCTWAYLQSALVLAEMGRIRASAVASVAKSLRRALMPEAEIDGLLRDAEKRLAVRPETVELAKR